MNSGGAHCLKYGVTTNNVLGVKMVLVDGTIVEIGGDHLDAPGLDLLGLIVGSEGQLGIVTEAELNLVPRPRAVGLLIPQFNSLAAALDALAVCLELRPSAVELLDHMDQAALPVWDPVPEGQLDVQHLVREYVSLSAK